MNDVLHSGDEGVEALVEIALPFLRIQERLGECGILIINYKDQPWTVMIQFEGDKENTQYHIDNLLKAQLESMSESEVQAFERLRDYLKYVNCSKNLTPTERSIVKGLLEDRKKALQQYVRDTFLKGSPSFDKLIDLLIREAVPTITSYN